jgi:iron(III) transport system permease protein
MIGRAMQDVLRTSGNTLLYAALASLIAVLLGIFLAICAGRDRRLQRILLTGLLVLLALPPSLSALGIAQAGSFAPEALDIVFRSHGTVGLALALRFLPIATILLLRSTSSFSSSWVSAAAIHGVGLFRYLSKVLLPMLLPAVLVAAVLVALLATAEVGIVLLVQPPGEASLPVAIFTVMANAPESLVATLCLIYVAGAATILMAAWAILLRRPAEFENEG